MLVYALADARRCSTVLHANTNRLVVETTGPARNEPLEIPDACLLTVHPAFDRVDRRWTASVALPCLAVNVRDGGTHHLLHGHHEVELQWVARTLSAAIGLSSATAAETIGPSFRAAG